VLDALSVLSLATVTSGGDSTLVYDGNGQRIRKTENGQTILYINRYFEKNLKTGEVTTYYYMGGRLVSMRKGASLMLVWLY
jgi:YD repeat-containing protein